MMLREKRVSCGGMLDEKCIQIAITSWKDQLIISHNTVIHKTTDLRDEFEPYSPHKT